VVNRWELEEHHIHTLTLAAVALDRCTEARELIAAEGLTVPTANGGSKLHPACRVESASMIAFARLLRELDLDIEPPAEDVKRPPMLRSIAGGR
jgi:hypothetical protein